MSDIILFEVGKTAVSLADALTVGGAAVAAGGAVRGGIAADQSADVQSAVLRQQATSASQNAAARERDFRLQQSRAAGTRRALQGVTGVESGAGSPLLAAEDFAAESELQALRIRAGGETQATRLEQQSDLEKLRGRQARQAGFTRAGSLLLTGAGTAFGTR